MLSVKYLELAQKIVDGYELTEKEALEIAHTPENRVFELLPGAAFIRRNVFGKKVHLCTILNAKSGRCSEDCSFCSQSIYADGKHAPLYPLKSKEEVQEGAHLAEKGGINRYSVVTSGKGLPQEDINKLCEDFSELDAQPHRTAYCGSLGVLDQEQMDQLYASGITRYHHNLEASKSYYPEICTTHSYEERETTIQAAKNAGMSVCSGGIFGIGEKDEHVVEMALALRKLDVDSVPVNFLMPIPGTRLAEEQKPEKITPLRALKIIAIFRYLLPQKHVLVCGGRIANLKELHSMIFEAGASGFMTGNYLTKDGRTLEQDLEMIQALGLEVQQ